MQSRQEIREKIIQKSQAISRKAGEIFGDYYQNMDFSSVGLFTALYYGHLQHDPSNPAWSKRDRVVLSCPAMFPSLLAVLSDLGYITWKECHETIIQLPKLLSSPVMSMVNYPGCDFFCQSAQVGMVFAMGSAFAGLKGRKTFRVVHVMPDIRSAEIQDMLMGASVGKLSNLTAVVPVKDLRDRYSTTHFWFSMGWQPEETNLDDVTTLFEGLMRVLRQKDNPQVVLC